MRKPQSNQRGIETPGGAGFGAPPPGLNRTSVGLKRTRPIGLVKARAGLNRTSVGLKQEADTRDFDRENQASIEPAWD